MSRLWLYENTVDCNNITGPGAVCTSRGKQPSMGIKLGFTGLLGELDSRAVSAAFGGQAVSDVKQNLHRNTTYQIILNGRGNHWESGNRSNCQVKGMNSLSDTWPWIL